MSNQTPLMKQYWEIKSLHQDKILFFRMGDFYEMFFDDATKAAPLLGIALTQRNKKSSDETPMCGFPHHSVAGPINKLLSHGLKVAICDQIEDPKLAKGIVKRAVTRVLTPGMVYDSETLDQTLAHYVASLCSNSSLEEILSLSPSTSPRNASHGSWHWSMAFVDMTTGECFYFERLNFQEVHRLMGVLPIAELVVPENFSTEELEASSLLISRHKMSVDEVRKNPTGQLNDPLSVRLMMSYLHSLNSPEQLLHLQKFSPRDFKKRMEVQANVLRHLEIFSTYKGEGSGSFFAAIQRTKTSAGSRLLRQWLSFPLQNQDEILTRQTEVDLWYQNPTELKRLREILGAVGDIERRLGKLSQPQCNARDLQSLAQSLFASLQACRFAQSVSPDFFQKVKKESLEADVLSQEILQSFVEEPPLSTKQGHLFRKGLRADLDEWIELTTETQNLVANLELRERESSGISSLKVRYNNVFGFYIEITNTHRDKAPAHYQRKQTLANAERFCTDELLELEKKVLSAQTKRGELEFEMFEQLRQKVLANATSLLLLAQKVSELDVFSGLAWLAIEGNYVKPQFSKERRLKLLAHRHPVVEQNVKSRFVPNDILLEPQHGLLLTGPNMAGKSTLMRQVALTALLAQIGSFVPAREAVVPIYDAIFTRIGASDQLSEGLSTFMVEMTETASMIKDATENSLLILDEVGRGTSTYDGMSLAQSILEFLMTKVSSTVFFATHYHELTEITKVFPNLHNAHMSVSEKAGDIRFLYTLQQGPAKKSYGIQVAELAGLPKEITQRAKSILRNLEKNKNLELSPQLTFEDANLSPQEGSGNSETKMEAITLENDKTTKLIELTNKIFQKVKETELNSMTPLQALTTLSEWQKEINHPQN